MSQYCIATNTLQDADENSNTFQNEYLKTLKIFKLVID